MSSRYLQYSDTKGVEYMKGLYQKYPADFVDKFIQELLPKHWEEYTKPTIVENSKEFRKQQYELRKRFIEQHQAYKDFLKYLARENITKDSLPAESANEGNGCIIVYGIHVEVKDILEMVLKYVNPAAIVHEKYLRHMPYNPLVTPWGIIYKAFTSFLRDSQKALGYTDISL